MDQRNQFMRRGVPFPSSPPGNISWVYQSSFLPRNVFSINQGSFHKSLLLCFHLLQVSYLELLNILFDQGMGFH
jgi:hypothetical protein